MTRLNSLGQPDYLDTVRRIALALPGVEDTISSGVHVFKLRGKMLVRMKDRETLILPVKLAERAPLIETQPDVFFITPEYKDWPAVLVNLARVDEAELRRLIVQAWREIAPKKLLEQYDSRGG